MKKQKSPWQIAKDKIAERAIKELSENYGISATYSQIAPKVYRDNPDHVLLFTEEFSSDLIYVMYRKDYSHFCDQFGRIHDEPIYFVIDKEKVAMNEYNKVSGASPKSWALPVEDLKMLVKKSKEVGKLVEIPFEYEQDEKTDDIIEDDTDQNISSMTIRDFYAIIWDKPVSSKSWLNNLIRKTKNNGRKEN
jgi:hypothetical protein